MATRVGSWCQGIMSVRNLRPVKTKNNEIKSLKNYTVQVAVVGVQRGLPYRTEHLPNPPYFNENSVKFIHD